MYVAVVDIYEKWWSTWKSFIYAKVTILEKFYICKSYNFRKRRIGKKKIRRGKKEEEERKRRGEINKKKKKEEKEEEKEERNSGEEEKIE